MSDRPETCCGVCPELMRGGYDCTCANNPRCPKNQPKNETNSLSRGVRLDGWKERSAMDNPTNNCTNCDNRKCMDCVFRAEHDECVDSCPECCPEYGEQLQAARDAEIRQIKAEAWDEGHRRGWFDRDSILDGVRETGTPNPYREAATE